MPSRSRVFRGSNKAQMGSNSMTTQSQGGGFKKAGFPYIVGRTQWTHIAFDQQAGINNLKFIMKDVGSSSISRPINSTYTPNTYFHIPGTR